MCRILLLKRQSHLPYLCCQLVACPHHIEQNLFRVLYSKDSWSSTSAGSWGQTVLQLPYPAQTDFIHPHKDPSSMLCTICLVAYNADGMPVLHTVKYDIMKSYDFIKFTKSYANDIICLWYIIWNDMHDYIYDIIGLTSDIIWGHYDILCLLNNSISWPMIWEGTKASDVRLPEKTILNIVHVVPRWGPDPLVECSCAVALGIGGYAIRGLIRSERSAVKL